LSGDCFCLRGNLLLSVGTELIIFDSAQLSLSTGNYFMRFYVIIMYFHVVFVKEKHFVGIMYFLECFIDFFEDALAMFYGFPFNGSFFICAASKSL